MPTFGQYFPAATRDAKNKATEREKARTKSTGSFAEHNGPTKPATPSASHYNDDRPNSSSARPYRDGSVPVIAYQAADDSEITGADMLHAVGSASSNESASSVFSSSSATNQAFGQVSKPKSADLTPLTNIDSPSCKCPPLPSQTPTVQDEQRTNGSASNGHEVAADGSSTAEVVLPPPVINRRPILDRSRPVAGVKCTYDPATDTSYNSNPELKKQKPKFSEFAPVRSHIIHKYCFGRGSVIFDIEAFG